MNLNTIARNIALKEGGAVNLKISDIKEVMRLFLEELATQDNWEITKILRRYR